MRIHCAILFSCLAIASAQARTAEHYRCAKTQLLLDLIQDARGSSATLTRPDGELVWRAQLEQEADGEGRYRSGEVRLLVGESVALSGLEAAAGTYTKLPRPERIALAKKALTLRQEQLRAAQTAASAACSEAQREALRKRGVIWKQDLELTARGAAPEQEIDPKRTVIYWTTLTEATIDRLTYLQRVALKGGEGAAAGRYRDGNGGDLLLLPDAGGGLRFRLDVVRGAMSHTGQLASIARLQEDKRSATYVEAGSPCRIHFAFDGGRLLLAGKETSEHHGNQAYFDGLYVRVGDLTDAERRALLELKP